jgi:hypothetical protein
MEDHYKAFLGIQDDVSFAQWDCQSSTKHCAAHNFYTWTGNLHVLLSSTINGFEYAQAG